VAEVGSRIEPPTTHHPRPTPTAVGYVIARDRYFKRDDVGIVYQLNVAPVSQRKLIGATLLKAVFDRAAYGCRLFCCWCAQDIEANRFWEAMGFVPLAFRTGSRTRGRRTSEVVGCEDPQRSTTHNPQPTRAPRERVHIFWQKRIRAGDTTTPWWFPAKTDAGALREDRLVLPIPPGLHWSDEMPRILPSASSQPAIEDQRGAGKVRRAKIMPPASMSGPMTHAARQYGAPPRVLRAAQAVGEKPKPQRKPKVKADPKLVAAARELRDRWLDRVNAQSSTLLPQAKYDVNRTAIVEADPAPLLLLPAPSAAA
jgi:hypothetical protein